MNRAVVTTTILLVTFACSGEPTGLDANGTFEVTVGGSVEVHYEGGAFGLVSRMSAEDQRLTLDIDSRTQVDSVRWDFGLHGPWPLTTGEVYPMGGVELYRERTGFYGIVFRDSSGSLQGYVSIDGELRVFWSIGNHKAGTFEFTAACYCDESPGEPLGPSCSPREVDPDAPRIQVRGVFSVKPHTGPIWGEPL